MRLRLPSTALLGVLAAVVVSGCSTTPPQDEAASGDASTSVSPPAVKTAGEITWCSDISAPPMEFYDEQKNPTGFDVDLGNEMAERLGLESVWRNTKFASIIPTLVAGQCDAINSELYIKPEREEVVDFVPYLLSGQSILTTAENPEGITGLDETLCGKRVSTTTSTTAFALVEELSATCVEDGAEEVTILRFQDDVSALQQLALGRSDAYATTSETAAYYMTKQEDTYAFAGESYETVEAGIAVKPGKTELLEVLTAAFEEIKEDGTYTELLEKWNLQQNAL